ncbi:MAG TPA: M1 family metallopeptidase [Gemmatimonadota bacterium]|nr:M1 family metallopeptidase [Gemmatimonadota bacterium]
MSGREGVRTAAGVLAAAAVWAMAAGAAPLAAQAREGSGGGSGTGPALGRLEPVTPLPLERAVAAGTRSRTGAPGPSYWQNGADYDIHASVSPRDSLLTASETVVYHNRSPDTLGLVVFHLYQNLMSPWAERESAASPDRVTHGLVIDRLVADGEAVAVPGSMTGRQESRGGAVIQSTLMYVPLPDSLMPGDSAVFQVDWHFTIPGADAPRMGMQDPATAQIAQWYPQIAVYDDVHGWDTEQYTGTGEFYLDYGHFRYSVTIPAGYIVGGTGTLENPGDVLTAAERSALDRAASSDRVVHVLAKDDFGAGTATRGAPGEALTWRFEADSVRDVAFSFGDHYLWDATRAMVDSARGRYAAVNVFWRVGAPSFDRVADMARSALETHSSLMVPYPWPQLTETEGVRGGMEYPMTVFVEAYDSLYAEDEVSAHEIGHEWFPMLVGSNETRYGWQDEGLNTFDTFFATDAYLPDSMRGEGLRRSQHGYVRFVQGADEDLQMMSPANAFGVDESGYGVEAYDKPSASLWALRSILGEAAFRKAYRAYIHRWSYRHPTPWDFFRTFDDVTGRDLGWFWGPWFFGRGRLDLAVAGVSQSGGTVTVDVARVGQLYAPVDVTATLADGSTAHWREPASVWFDGSDSVRTSHAVGGRVTSVQLDAAHDFPDVDRSNDGWKGGS